MFCSVKRPRGHELGISDPRGLSYGYNEEFFAVMGKNLTYCDALQEFPVIHSGYTKAHAELQRIGREREVVRRHPELFVFVDNKAPEVGGVTIVRLSWDHDVGRSESELRRTGRESRVETLRCEVDALVDTLERMAGNWSDHVVG